jgi:hypothetical protein
MKVLRNLFTLLLVTGGLLVQAQTADEIVAKHIAAIGGADSWKKVNSMYQEGSMTVQGTDVAIAMTVLHKKGMRQNISLMGMTGYQIMTPTAGWNFMPFQGQQKPEAITADELKENVDELDTQGELIDYKTKGHTVEYLGKDDVEGTEAYKLRITQKSGKVKTFYIDPASNYIIRTVAKQKANGQEVEVTTDLSDYKKLPEGIVVPMSVKLPFGQMKVTKVEVNKPVDENLFKPDTK